MKEEPSLLDLYSMIKGDFPVTAKLVKIILTYPITLNDNLVFFMIHLFL